MTTLSLPKKKSPKEGESLLVRRIREAAGKLEGVALWRNNVGVLEDRNGTKVKFGLCVGSADLVGVQAVTVTQDMVGKTIGRFVAIEVKVPGKKPREEQCQFLDLVTMLGGYACWVDSVEEALEHIKGAHTL